MEDTNQDMIDIFVHMAEVYVRSDEFDPKLMPVIFEIQKVLLDKQKGH